MNSDRTTVTRLNCGPVECIGTALHFRLNGVTHVFWDRRCNVHQNRPTNEWVTDNTLIPQHFNSFGGLMRFFNVTSHSEFMEFWRSLTDSEKVYYQTTRL